MIKKLKKQRKRNRNFYFILSFLCWNYSYFLFLSLFFRSIPSPQQAEADRNALKELGMSVSKKNSEKKTPSKEASKKRKSIDLQTSIAALEEKVILLFSLFIML